MHLSRLLYSFWISLLACNLICASPILITERGQTRNKVGIQKRSPALQSGKIRFGFELETILQFNKNGRAFKEFKHRINAQKPEDYNSIFKGVRNYLTKAWEDFTPEALPTFESSWLNAMKPALAKMNIQSGKKIPLLDRFGDSKDERKGDYYKVWSITEDTSIKADGDQWQFPIEFLSPVFEIGGNVDQTYIQTRYQVEAFFEFLNAVGFDIIKDPSTSTHVHISPLKQEGPWTKEQAIRIAASALFFEPALRFLLPKDRHNNPHAREWRQPNWLERLNTKDNAKVDALDSKEKVLDAIKRNVETADMTIEKLIWVMNPPLHSKRLDDLISGRLEPDRHWGWNFLNLAEGEKGTIECRRGAQSTTASEAMFNIELVTGFALAACVGSGNSHEYLSNFDLTNGSFKRFMASIPGSSPSSGNSIDSKLPKSELTRKFEETKKDDGHDESKVPLDNNDSELSDSSSKISSSDESDNEEPETITFGASPPTTNKTGKPKPKKDP